MTFRPSPCQICGRPLVYPASQDVVVVTHVDGKEVCDGTCVKQIAVPAGALSVGSRECVRVFHDPKAQRFLFAINGQTVSEHNADPGAWGILVGNLGRHVARHLEGQILDESGRVLGAQEIFQRIAEVATEELAEGLDRDGTGEIKPS